MVELVEQLEIVVSIARQRQREDRPVAEAQPGLAVIDVADQHAVMDRVGQRLAL